MPLNVHASITIDLEPQPASFVAGTHVEGVGSHRDMSTIDVNTYSTGYVAQV